MARMRPKKNGPNLSGINIDEMNLSDDEKEQLQKLSGKQTGAKPTNPTVSQKVHEDAINELKERISDLESKIDEIKEDRTKIREERDDYKTRFETKVDENKKLSSDLDDLKGKNRDLSDRVGELENALKKKAAETVVVRDDAEVERLNKENDGLKEKLKKSEEQRESLESEVTALQTRVDSMKSEIDDLLNRNYVTGEIHVELEQNQMGTVRRSTATRFESDLFDDGKYLVRLARNGRSISFTPDVEGSAICIGGGIELPRLKDLVPFQGIRECKAIVRNGSEIMVLLD